MGIPTARPTMRPVLSVLDEEESVTPTVRTEAEVTVKAPTVAPEERAVESELEAELVEAPEPEVVVPVPATTVDPVRMLVKVIASTKEVFIFIAARSQVTSVSTALRTSASAPESVKLNPT
jgi:hypothetical protein